jgi:hypothetical protein
MDGIIPLKNLGTSEDIVKGSRNISVRIPVKKGYRTSSPNWESKGGFQNSRKWTWSAGVVHSMLR